MTLAEAPASTLLRSLKLRSERDPLRFFRPASPEQAEALTINAKGALIIGGNRSGKSQIGAVRAVAKGTGREVEGQQFKKAKRIWCVSQELPSQQDKPHTQLEAIRRWMPVDALRGGSWGRAYSPGSFTLTLADGTKYEFKSYDQDLLAFESAAVDHIWFDEEPTRKAIFTSCLLRLVDRRGTWDMTLTPVQSLQGKSGIAEELWEAKAAGEAGESPFGAFRTVQLYTSHNVHLPQDEVKALETLPEEEKQVRLYGAFARLGGRVLSEFSPQRHLVPPQLPSRDWRHYLVIDPGWHTAAHLFAAVDNRGRILLYAEHYAREEPILDRVAICDAIWKAAGCPEFEKVIVDSAAFDNIRQGGTERLHPSDVAEYREAAEELGCEWFQPSRSKKGDEQAYRVQRYLAADMLFVCRDLKWWQWEQERWTRQRDREGALAQERAVPDKPIDRFNHLMDTTRYLINELPDPLPVPASDVYDPYAEHWKRARREPEPEIV
jgi:phage terminase large subunit-like protein